MRLSNSVVVRMSAVMLAAVASSCAGAPSTFEERHPGGALARRGTLVDGRQEGVWTFWYPNGALRARGSYAGDVRTGHWTHWYEDGQLRMEGSYSDDRQEGAWVFFHPDGSPRCRGSYERGRETGEWTYFHPGGGVRQRGVFDDGRRALRWRAWYPDGGPEREGFYLDDEPVGEWSCWDAEGACTKRVYPMPDGWRLVRERWEDGSPRREGFLFEGVPEGPWASWHRDGSRRLLGAFRHGEPAGEWHAFVRGGALAAGPVAGGLPAGVWRIGEGGARTLDLDGRPVPQPPWDGEWSAADIVDRLPVEDVVARWLREIAAPPEAEALPAVVEAEAPPSAPAIERVEAPTDPGDWTVREAAELPLYLRYYEDGFLPRRHAVGSGYGVAAGARRLGNGDREHASELIGKRLPVTRFHTADGGELDLEAFRGKKVLFLVLKGFSTQVCVYCFAQTAALVPYLPRIEDLDTEIVVLYPGARSRLDAFLRAYAEEFGGSERPPYHMVYDPDLELTRALDIAANLARPTALVLDDQGIVRYAYIAESDANIADRPPATELLSALEELL